MAQSVGCQLATARAASSLPTILVWLAPMAHDVPIGSKVSGIAMRLAHTVGSRGDVATELPTSWSSEAAVPLGTATSQHLGITLAPSGLPCCPHPRPGACRPVSASKSANPVPSANVREKSTSLVVLKLK